MANMTSQLVVRLRDDVSGPAGRAARSLRGLKNEARGSAAIQLPRADGVGALAGGLVRTGLAAGAAYVGIQSIAGGLKNAYLEAASFDRQMTRIGITADASVEATKAATKQVEGIAREVRLPVNEVVGGLDALVASGKSLPEALAILPAIAMTAQASGAAVNDIARSAEAVGSQFKIGADGMLSAFDMMAKAGKDGKFELKDMAQYFPSLAAQAAALGFKGTDGLATLSSALQMVRRNTGDASEAATAFSDVLGKMESDGTIKAFKEEFGIDLEKSFKKARKEGANLFEVFEAALVRITEKDLSNVNKVFADKEARRGALAIAQYARERRKMDEQIRRESSGTVAADANRAIQDSQSKVDNLSNAWGRFGRSVGRGLDAAGASTALEAMAKSVERAADRLDAISKRYNEGGVKSLFGDLIKNATEELRQHNAAFDEFDQRNQAFERKRDADKRKTLEESRPSIEARSQEAYGDNRLTAGVDAQLQAIKATETAQRALQDAAFALDLEMQKERRRREAAVEHAKWGLEANRRNTAPKSPYGIGMERKGQARLAAAEAALADLDAAAAALKDVREKAQALDTQLGAVRGLRINQTGGQTAPILGGGASFGLNDRGIPEAVESLWGGDPNAPMPPVRPKVDTTELDAAKGKATEAGDAVCSLDTTVAPRVDTAGLDALNAKLDTALGKLAQLNGGVRQAAAGVSRLNVQGVPQQTASRDLGRQFEGRRRATFADNELT